MFRYLLDFNDSLRLRLDIFFCRVKLNLINLNKSLLKIPMRDYAPCKTKEDLKIVNIFNTCLLPLHQGRQYYQGRQYCQVCAHRCFCESLWKRVSLRLENYSRLFKLIDSNMAVKEKSKENIPACGYLIIFRKLIFRENSSLPVDITWYI